MSSKLEPSHLGVGATRPRRSGITVTEMLKEIPTEIHPSQHEQSLTTVALSTHFMSHLLRAFAVTWKLCYYTIVWEPGMAFKQGLRTGFFKELYLAGGVGVEHNFMKIPLWGLRCDQRIFHGMCIYFIYTSTIYQSRSTGAKYYYLCVLPLRLLCYLIPFLSSPLLFFSLSFYPLLFLPFTFFFFTFLSSLPPPFPLPSPLFLLPSTFFSSFPLLFVLCFILQEQELKFEY